MYIRRKKAFFINVPILMIYAMASVVILMITILWLNFKVKETNWYRNAMPRRGVFPDEVTFMKEKGAVDILVIGSSSGVYDFDFSGIDIKAYNMSLVPQSTERCFDVLKKYCTLLRGGGVLCSHMCLLLV